MEGSAEPVSLMMKGAGEGGRGGKDLDQLDFALEDVSRL